MGAIVAAMLLEHDVADGNLSTCLVAAEVKDEFYAGEVETRHVALVEHIVLVGLELYHFIEVEFAVVGFLADLHRHVVVVLSGGEHAREVVVGGRVGSHVGVEEILALPLVGGRLGECKGEGTAVDSLYGVGNLVPARSIPVGISIVGGAEHIAVAVVLESLEIFFCSGFLGDEDIMPRNGPVVIDEFHVLGLEVHNLELRRIPLVIIGDVGELGVGRQHEEHVVALHGEVVGGLLLVGGHHHVFRGGTVVGLRECLDFLVDIHRATFSRIIDIGSVGHEGHHIVIYTVVGLVVGSSRPPLGAVGSRGATSQMGGFGTGDKPLFAFCIGSCHTCDITGEVDNGVVEMEGLLSLSVTDAVTVAHAVLHGIVAGVSIDLGKWITCGIGLSVNNPNRILRGVVEFEFHLVDFLVNLHRHIGVTYVGYSVGVESGVVVGRARRHCHASHQETSDIFCYFLHNLHRFNSCFALMYPGRHRSHSAVWAGISCFPSMCWCDSHNCRERAQMLPCPYE